MTVDAVIVMQLVLIFSHPALPGGTCQPSGDDQHHSLEVCRVPLAVGLLE